MIAKVVVDVPASAIDRLFDYIIPEEFAGMVEKGMRVSVPFGPRKIQGFVVGIEEEGTSEHQLKSINDVSDVEPVLTEELLKVGFWMAEQTTCFTISALQAMLPAALKAAYQKELRISSKGAKKLPNEMAALFSDEKPVIWETLSIEHPELLTQIQREIRSGSVEVIHHVRDRISKKTERVVQPNVENRVLMKECDSLSNRAAKQKQILSFFIEHPEPVAIKDLTDSLSITRSTVKTLIHKGLLLEEQREVYRDPYAGRDYEKTEPLLLTEEQQAAMGPILRAIENDIHETTVLHGVTGSGKTEIYLQAIESVLQRGEEAIVLVPEISLTPQMVSRFKGRFGSSVAVLHSGLSRGEKYDEWRKIQRNEVSVVVGARSAVFAPFTNIGIIIIDEEHESSYKQEEQPRYHARDVAIYRGSLHNCPVVLGSATPSLESYARAEKGVYRLASLQERINRKAMPGVEIIDMREELRNENRSMFSSALYDKLQDRLVKGEQSVLFLNRRGYSTFMMCRDCGYVTECPHCDISLTYHKKGNALKCHYCGYQQALPKMCPSCESPHIRFFGTGTQKVEEELGKVLPEARVIRMDVDTTSRKGMHEKHLKRFADQKADILLGTQMIAKGLDFPSVTLVGVLAADSTLHLPDFRAAERTFQLLTQVSGRAGRHELPGEVIVQSYTPEHYSIELASHHDFETFYNREMRERRTHGYPPYYFLALVTISDPDLTKAAGIAEKITNFLNQQLSRQAIILGPVSAAIPRVKDRYRYQCMVKYKREPSLHDSFAKIVEHYGKAGKHKDLQISVDLNPQMLM
ncbi:MAG TPA: primosomal protein N' [Bacillales bacterium]|nr:primosomal protein N' [Bacillales bacterium]